MDAKQFLEQYPSDVPLICERAGTKPVYFKQIASGFRRPSPDLARKLAEASGGRMNVWSLLFPADHARTVANS